MRGDVAGDDAAGADDGPVSDGDALQEEAVHADKHVVADLNGPGGAGVDVLAPTLGRKRMKVGVHDGCVAADEDAVSDPDGGVGDEGGAGKPAVVADDDLGLGGAGGEDDRVRGRKGIGAGPGAEGEPFAEIDAAAAVLLQDRPTEDPPATSPVDAVPGELQPDERPRQTAPQLQPQEPGHVADFIDGRFRHTEKFLRDEVNLGALFECAPLLIRRPHCSLEDIHASEDTYPRSRSRSPASS